MKYMQGTGENVQIEYVKGKKAKKAHMVRLPTIHAVPICGTKPPRDGWERTTEPINKEDYLCERCRLGHKFGWGS